MGQNKQDFEERAKDIARSLIDVMENKLLLHGELDRYDVFCEWYEEVDQLPDVELWLRDRSDDSRIGPLDVKAHLGH
jgi:hypothetical protein